MSAFAIGKAPLRLFVILSVSLASQAALGTDVWEAHWGDPCCGLPDSSYKYLDANEACIGEIVVPPDTQCVVTDPGTLRNNAGPQTNGACVFDQSCLCGDCIIGSPGDPRNFHQTSYAGKVTGHKTQACTAGTTEHLGLCFQDTPKGKGPCPDCENLAKANPVNIGSGNKYQSETVYRAASGQLELILFYNSQAGTSYFESLSFGTHWTVRYLVGVRDSGQGIIAVHRPDGRDLQFRAPTSGTLYLGDADIADTLEKLIDGSGTLIGWRYSAKEGDEVEEFNAAGKLLLIRNRAGLQQTMTYSTASTPASIAPGAGLLIAVTDSFGRQLSFTYDAQRRVNSMTDPAGGQYSFEYDGSGGPAAAGNLTKVTFPDTRTRIYFYNEAAQINGGAACPTLPPVLNNALTGLSDENGSRYATWTYDCQARTTSSVHALGVELYTFNYGTGTSTAYVDPLGTSRSAGLQRTLGVARGTGTTQPAASGSGTVSTSATYDVNGNIASRTDRNGNRTDYNYDLARNLETSRTEGLTAAGGTTPQTRTITTQSHPTFRLPTQIVEPLRTTTNAYDADGTQCGARGALCSKTVQAASGATRTWTYTYDANGQVLTVNGPRSDVPDLTTYTYDTQGNVASIANAAGHLTSISAYNAHGQPRTIVDPNGMTITLGYDARQRLTSRNSGGELTSYDYDGVGQLTKVTLPDGSHLSYSYDAAHRLTGMSDSLGSSIAYTLDAMGNRTREQVRDPGNSLVQTRSRVYNNLNRLFQELGAQNQTTEYAYDDQGNVVSVKDPLNHVTSNQYDALNRLKQVTDPNLGVTQYAYNGLDALTQVTDPRSLVTGYTVDGLGNLTQQASPDTGTTVNTYDAAGNLLTQTDAKGQVTTYTYDALNRVTLITFNDSSKQSYVYDQGANAKGRLSSITETNAANAVTNQIAYAYDLHGRVTSEARTVNGVQYVLGYSYDNAGRLSGMTYPSGRTLTYAFDGLSRVNQVTTTKDSQSHVVVSGVLYQPFGGVQGYTLGNGQVYSRGIDLDGRIASYTLGAQSFGIGYDAASRIQFISDFANSANTNNYDYDSIDRLTSAVTPSTPYAYSYDAVGNRMSRAAGAGTDSYAYSSSSNRIASITPSSGPVRSFVFDPNGSTTADGNNTYAYDTRGRMVQATSSLGTTTYQVNALGQRIRKTNSLGDTVFHYDTRGRLIAETDAAGGVKRELIYLGDIPVSVVQ
jgi:YD repeat-containing protein